MKGTVRGVVGLLLGLVLVVPAQAIELEPGQWIELKATSPQGVPLHRNPRPSLMGRAPDGARAEVLALDAEKHWIRIRLEDDRTGWIVDRYVGRVVEAPAPTPSGPASNDDWLVWGSADGCRQVVAAGRRMAPPRPEVLRVGTWNIRWFPQETDLPWLACTIAWMNLDLLAVVEITATPGAQTAMTQVLSSLRDLTGTPWQVDLHACGRKDAQHVGYLWNTARVSLSDPADRWHFNARATPTSSPCARGLRPGRYAYVQATGGGVDLHAIVVHLKSGATLAAQQERLAVLERLNVAVADLLPRDTDLVILGDFNTMGNGASASGAEELQTLATIAALKAPGFARLNVDPPCTEYFRGHGGWLDHVLASRGMQEIPAASAQVTGYCAVKSCANIGTEKPAAYQRLSDHCPVVFQIENRDLD